MKHVGARPVKERYPLLVEFAVAGRFAVVGLVATVIHVVIAVALVSIEAWSAIPANMAAFAAALGVSFLGHYWWTFRRPGNPGRAVMRFFLVSAAAFVINNMAVVALMKSALLSPEWVVVLAAALVPAISFAASRLWAFRRA